MNTTMTLPGRVTKWWEQANHRRQILINRKHRDERGLTGAEDAELTMLQAVAEAVLEYGSLAFCRMCGGKLAQRDLGNFPLHVCTSKKSSKGDR